MKCEKCKEGEGTECVYYSEHEGYLCKSCYRKWLRIARTIPVKNNNYKPHEKQYLEWIRDGDSMKKYYTINFDDEIDIDPIYEYQIIGKVVSHIDNNIWNRFSLEIWAASINNLNAVALFTK